MLTRMAHLVAAMARQHPWQHLTYFEWVDGTTEAEAHFDRHLQLNYTDSPRAFLKQARRLDEAITSIYPMVAMPSERMAVGFRVGRAEILALLTSIRGSFFNYPDAQLVTLQLCHADKDDLLDMGGVCP
jgi:hypothetical protein